MNETNRSTLIAIALPLLLAVVYLSATLKPWHREKQSAPPSPEEYSRLWSQCDTDFKAANYRQALVPALKLHQVFPGNHIYLERIAETYDLLGDYTHEAEFWEHYFDSAPNPVTACPQMGQAYWKANDKAKAVDAFERCLKRDPDNADSIFFLAHALEQTGQLNRAANLYAAGLKTSPNYLDMRTGIARIALREGKIADAKNEIQKVLERSPDNVDALLIAGLASSQEHDFLRARQYLERGVRLSDGYLDFHAALADVAVEQKNYPEAARQYNRILHDRPNDQDIRAKLDALRGN